MAAARATFLLGLIAADRRDVPALSAALDALPQSDDQPEIRADRLHLTGRLHLIRKEYQPAADAFMAEEALRRASGDEPGVARALALAAEATEMSGRKALAADLWFRSGRSAAQEGDAASRHPPPPRRNSGAADGAAGARQRGARAAAGSESRQP